MLNLDAAVIDEIEDFAVESRFDTSIDVQIINDTRLEGVT